MGMPRSDRPVVLLYEPLHDVAMRFLEERAEVRLAPNWEERTILRLIGDVEGLIIRSNGRVTRKILEAAPNLKVVGRHGVGVDNIDCQAAQDLGITVVYTPGANTEAVAEYCVGLMLALARHIVQGDKALRSGDWRARYRLIGTELFGKTLGVVGFGRIGQRVARICHDAFAMQVLYFDIVEYPDVASQIGARRVSLDELLRTADIVSLHVPLLPETRGLINEENLRKMKRSALLINTSRGPVVDQEALIRALQEGWIAGAALDVFDPEPLPQDSPLLRLDNVVVTPHMAAHSEEGLVRMGMAVAEDVMRVIRGEPPVHPYVLTPTG